MRSKQLNETSELVCISSALKNSKKQPGGNHKKKAVMSPSESIGMKINCNQIRKFTPLGRYFGLARGQGGNPLMNDKDRSNDSFLSFQEDELRNLDADLASDFL